MTPFKKHTGLVAPLDRVNVDTDQMAPKQFLKALTGMREAGDFESEEARRLLELVRQTPNRITEAEFSNQRLKREIIEEVKASAPTDQPRCDQAEAGRLQGNRRSSEAGRPMGREEMAP
jgi:hypothetical protein